MFFNPIKSVRSHGSGQVPPKGAPVPGHGLEHLINRSESERIGSNRIESNRIESVRSHCSGQVPPKGALVPGHGLEHLTNQSESERIRSNRIEADRIGTKPWFGTDAPKRGACPGPQFGTPWVQKLGGFKNQLGI